MTNSVEFIARFIEKLGDVKDWDHNGIVNDLGFPKGYCVCGHPIQFEYELINKINGKKAVVGSDCINNFKEYSPELFASLMATIERVKKEEKEAKLLLESAELETLKTKYNSLSDTLVSYYHEQRSKKVWVSHDVYTMVSLVEKDIPAKKTLRGYISYLTKKIAEIEKVLEVNNIIPMDVNAFVEASKEKDAIKESIKSLVGDDLPKVLKCFNNKSLKYPLYTVLENYTTCFTDNTYSIEDLKNLLKVIETLKYDFTNKKIVKYEASGKTYNYRDYFHMSNFCFNYDKNVWEKYDYSGKDFSIHGKITITMA